MVRAVGRKVNKPNRSPLRKGDLLFYSLLLIIPLVQIGIFYFGVNFQSFFLAFQTKTEAGFVFDVSKNWNAFVSDLKTSIFWIYIRNSFLVYLFSTLAGTVLATIFSYYIYKRRTLCNFFKFVLFLPSILPAILLVIMFKGFVGNGLPAYLNFFFHVDYSQEIGGGNIFLKENTATIVVITMYSIWISFGSQVLVYTGAMDQIPPEIIEAGKIDGTNSFTEFVHIILPSILETIGTFLIVGVASIFTNQNNLFNFYGGGGPATHHTIGYYLYIKMRDGEANYPYVSFVGLVFTAFIIPLTFAVRKIITKITK